MGEETESKLKTMLQNFVIIFALFATGLVSILAEIFSAKEGALSTLLPLRHTCPCVD